MTADRYTSAVKGGEAVTSTTKRKRSAPLAGKRAQQTRLNDSACPNDTTPDVRTYRRRADWQGWDFEPPIVFTQPVNVRKLLGREDDETPIE